MLATETHVEPCLVLAPLAAGVVSLCQVGHLDAVRLQSEGDAGYANMGPVQRGGGRGGVAVTERQTGIGHSKDPSSSKEPSWLSRVEELSLIT